MMIFRLALTIVLMGAPLCQGDMKSTLDAKIHAIGEHQYVIGITVTPEENWHTYWINPGEAGMPLSVDWQHPTLKESADSVAFPTPQRYVLGGIVTYGYGSAATTLYYLQGEGGTAPLAGRAQWLCCDETSCLPGEAEFSLPVPRYDSLALRPAWLIKAEKALPALLSSEQAMYYPAPEEGHWIFELPSDERFEPFTGGEVYSVDEAFSETDPPRLLRPAGQRLVSHLRGPRQTDRAQGVTLLLKNPAAQKGGDQKGALVTFSRAKEPRPPARSLSLPDPDSSESP